METEKIEKIVDDMQRQIKESIFAEEEENEKSFNNQTGILLTREEAILCRKILRLYLISKY